MRELAPPTCSFCDASLPDETPPFCGRCWRRLGWFDSFACRLCQERACHAGTDRCGHCTILSGLDACLAGAAYRGDLRDSLRRFKYPAPGALREAAPLRAARWLICDAARRAGAAPEAVVAIPHHPSRLRSRGFVPSVLLARALARKYRLPFLAGALVRIRDTPSQTGLGRRARAANLRGAFRAVTPVPSRLWLADDVVTTGATFCEAAEVLGEAGASRVVGLAAARTPRDGTGLVEELA